MSIFKNTVVVVYAFIKNNKDEFLVVKRADHDTCPGIWEMPGGTLEFGESLDIGVVREVKEEAGLDVEVLAPIIFESQVKGDIFKKHKVRVSFKVLLKDDNQKVILSNDHSDFKWTKSIEDKQTSPLLLKTLKALNK